MSGSLRKILVADDTHVIRTIIRQIGEEKGFSVLEAEDGKEALFVAEKFLPDLIVLDVNMPRVSGIEVLWTLRQNDRFAHTAIIMLSGDRDQDVVNAAILVGASDYLIKDDKDHIRQKLEPYLHLLAKPPGTEKRVLVVDDTRLVRHVVGKIFEEGGCEVLEAENGIEGLAMAIKHLPDLIVLDVMMPKMNGIEALKEIRANENLKATPVTMLTAEKDLATIRQILSAGVADYILKENSADLESRLKNYLKLMS
jgi:CheY-like chemotaxis protein